VSEANPAATGLNVDPTALLGARGGIGRQLLVSGIAIFLGLAVGAVLIVLSGAIKPDGVFDLTLPITAYGAMIEGAVWNDEGLNLRGIGNALNAATPLILTGLSVAFAFRAGLFNIGANGQFLVGAFSAAIVATNLVNVPILVALPLSIAGGAIGGGLWGLIPGALKAWRGAHEVVTTIMLNNIAGLLLNLLASSTFRDPAATFPRTPDIQPGTDLPILFERLHSGIFIALLAAIGVWFLLFRTTLGFEIRTVGANPNAARYAGIRPALIIVLTMTIAGGLAGLAGSAEILGITGHYPAEYFTTLGFDGIAVALIGRAHPIGVIGGALLFGFMRAGAGSMQRATDIPVDIIQVVQGVILLFVAAEIVIRRLLPAVRARRRTAAAAEGV
jgi:general nucleoside transport system permease protein